MSDLGSTVSAGSLWLFRSPLNVLDERDRDLYPWLNNDQRYYQVVRELSRGGFAIACLAVACDASGKQLYADQLVMKFPRLDRSGRFSQIDQADRLQTTDKKTLDEWRFTHRRLRDSPCATHIIDLDTQWIDSRPCIVTVQPFLREHAPLLTWLAAQDLLPATERDQLLWRGFHHPSDWKRLCFAIARAIDDVHSRRVIHADLWPPNIFIETACKLDAVSYMRVQLIDFGESTTFFPTGKALRQPDHPYRAPERDKPHFIPSEQIDVYSFGKLALFLAAGGPPILTKGDVGRKRRKCVRDHVKMRNARFLEECPEAIDVIARCTSIDPVERPSMAELVTDLAPSARIAHDWKTHSVKMMERTLTMARRYEELFSHGRHILRHLVDERVAAIENLLNGFDTEMVRTEGSRNDMIHVLVSLFGEMRRGDSYTSITSPSVWQSHALGLDGRLMSATIQAVRRGVTVQRGYMVAIEEIGTAWLGHFMELLDKHKEEAISIRQLLAMLASKAQEYNAACATDDTIDKDGTDFHCTQVSSVLTALREMVETWRLRDLLNKQPFSSINGSSGLFLGIIPLATRNCVHEMRIENPAALMGCRPSEREEKEWVLVVTDIRGRDVDRSTSTPPTLRGVRAYRSFYDLPNDRIHYVEKAFREGCVNIGDALPVIAECAMLATEKCATA
jgi:serine/threonine protein kinase